MTTSIDTAALRGSAGLFEAAREHVQAAASLLSSAAVSPSALGGTDGAASLASAIASFSENRAAAAYGGAQADDELARRLRVSATLAEDGMALAAQAAAAAT